MDDLLKAWAEIAIREKIPHIKYPLAEKQPVPLEVLKKTGIYPKKGYLHPGGELSYNLYWSEKMDQADENLDHIVQEKNLIITVHKGKLVRVWNKIFYREAFGEELRVNRPAFFQ